MSPPKVAPFFLVTDDSGTLPLAAYKQRQQVGTKLRWVEDGRAFYWAPDTGLVEVTETFWWGCFNVRPADPVGGWASGAIPGRIYRGRR